MSQTVKLPAERRDMSTNVRLSESEDKALDRLAKHMNVTPAQTIRLLIKMADKNLSEGKA
jgi:predicted DNA-binding protein